MRFTLWPERVSGAGGRFGSWIGSAAAFLLVIVVAANIIARILGHSIPGILDISQNFMVIIVVMMLAYTQAQRGHIGVEFVLNFLPESGRRVVGLITLLLSLAFAVLLAWQSWAMAWFALEVRDHSGVYPYLPLYPGKLILALGVSLLCLQLLVDVWVALRRVSSSTATE
jgi:TRAP-type C4-dicarboxylate transport system permease small subunit